MILPSTRRFSGEDCSLRSCPANGKPSTTPSLNARSLKGKKSLALPMPSLLGLKRRLHESPIMRNGIKDLDAPGCEPIAIVNEKPADVNFPSSSPVNIVANTPIENDVPHHNDPTLPQRPRSKSRAFLRIITTKFERRPPPLASPSVPPRSSNRPPANATSFAFKQNREAALRERGLLPPLEPNKDLSLQEHEQDHQIPIVAPTDPEVVVADSDGVKKLTAATLVKQEWEAKNNFTPNDLAQRQRMGTFKFGGMSPPSSPAVEQIPSPVELETVTEVDSPLPSPALPRDDEPTSPSGPTDASRSTPPQLELKLDTNNGDALPHIAISLPSSPVSCVQGASESPKSVSDGHDQGTCLSTEHVEQKNSPAPLASPPLISLTPHASATWPKSPTNGSSHKRNVSFPPQKSNSESDSSIMTPSWDTASQTMTISTLGTSESSPGVNRVKFNGLKVKTNDKNIPIIVESPVEETFFKSSIDEVAENDFDVISKGQPASLAQTRSRSKTDPGLVKAAGEDRRKSLRLFKRVQVLDSSDPSNPPPKRLSMAASLTNMRRSMVGTLSRSKSTMTFPRGFDASQLPPSPTLPSAYAEQMTRTTLSSASEVGARPRPRQAVAPTLHSRGSILLETFNIEDDETRRMTEMAFLG